MHRQELFEDPLDSKLAKAGYGEICGGGTGLTKEGEVEYCDIEIRTSRPAAEIIPFVIEALERLRAPKGSMLHLTNERRQIPFGLMEGLAVYLNGTDLPDEVYRDCDANFVYSEFDRLLEGAGSVFSYWQGPAETALYAYGASFDEMRRRILGFIAGYPLCQRCRVVEIA